MKKGRKESDFYVKQSNGFTPLYDNSPCWDNKILPTVGNKPNFTLIKLGFIDENTSSHKY